MGSNQQWLPTQVYSTVSRGQNNNRTIRASGNTTTVRNVPAITRTTTEEPITQTQLTYEDEGVTLSFIVETDGDLGTVPAGAAEPADPMCPGSGTGNALTDGDGNVLTDGAGAPLTQ